LGIEKGEIWLVKIWIEMKEAVLDIGMFHQNDNIVLNGNQKGSFNE